MTGGRGVIEVKVHDTPPEIYDPLARVFGETTGGDYRWVSIETEVARVVFFAAGEGRGRLEVEVEALEGSVGVGELAVSGSAEGLP